MQLSAALIAASVAIVVAFLTPAVTSLRARREAINVKFDRALAALLLVQAARYTPTGLNPQHAADGLMRGDIEARNLRMTERGIDFYIESTAAAKAAMIDIEQYVPAVRSIVTGGWELREEDEPEIRGTIETARAPALKSERLFRQRRHLPGSGQPTGKADSSKDTSRET